MTSPQVGLFPARSDDRLPALTAAQLVACGGLEFGQGVRTEVRQGVTRLRRKIFGDDADPGLIRTERGAGYVFDAEVHALN